MDTKTTSAHPPEVKTKKDFAALDRHKAAVRAKWAEARRHVRDFLHRLCTLRVLDPACGSANFLYVTLEHLKRLEGEVLNQLGALGDTQDALDLAGETVTLQQLRGVELNERAGRLVAVGPPASCRAGDAGAPGQAGGRGAARPAGLGQRQHGDAARPTAARRINRAPYTQQTRTSSARPSGNF